MGFIDILLNYLDKSSAITIFVLALLSFYLFLSLWIFFYKYFELISFKNRESKSLEELYMGVNGSVTNESVIYNFLKKSENINENILKACKFAVEKKVSQGLTILSLIASTSPFIGLFGTVVSILETFATLGESKSATLAVVAPAISEALVATAGGILVAIFGYSFHLLIKRKGYEVYNLVSMQIDLLLSER